jgi:viologen exporter family transport system permease protein
MEAYLGFARRGFQRAITYPFQVWAELGINLLFMYIYVCLWRALYAGRDSVIGYDRRQMLTYIVVAQTLITFQFTIRTANTIEAKIRSGEVVIDLMRPIDFQATLLATGFGTALHTLLTNMGPKFALFAIMGVVGPPASPAALLLFALSAVLGFVILFDVEFLIGITAFWLVEVRGLYAAVMWGLNSFLSGYFVPLEFYPPWLAALARALPFQAITYTPSALYTGTLAGPTALAALLAQAAWVAALLGAGRLLFRTAYRRLVVQGG